MTIAISCSQANQIPGKARVLMSLIGMEVVSAQAQSQYYRVQGSIVSIRLYYKTVANIYQSL